MTLGRVHITSTYFIHLYLKTIPKLITTKCAFEYFVSLKQDCGSVKIVHYFVNEI